MQLRLSLKSSIVSQLREGRNLQSLLCHSKQKNLPGSKNSSFVLALETWQRAYQQWTGVRTQPPWRLSLRSDPVVSWAGGDAGPTRSQPLTSAPRHSPAMSTAC